jgi:hypothetical protein
MAEFSDWSATAASNTTIDGTDIAEGCAPGNINNAIRSIMAAAKTFANEAVNGDNYMLKAGGAFTGEITRDGRGGYWHFNSSSLTGGKVYVQTVATALPASPAEGTVVFQY